MASMTLADHEAANTEAALRGDPAMVYALLCWARRTREGLAEPELTEARLAAEVLMKDRASNGALSEVRSAMGSGSAKK
jgi:hypothetical protein